MKEKLAAGIEATRAILMSAPADAHPDIVKGVVFDRLKPLLYLCRLTEMRNEREQFDAREVSVIRVASAEPSDLGALYATMGEPADVGEATVIAVKLQNDITKGSVARLNAQGADAMAQETLDQINAVLVADNDLRRAQYVPLVDAIDAEIRESELTDVCAASIRTIVGVLEASTSLNEPTAGGSMVA